MLSVGRAPLKRRADAGSSLLLVPKRRMEMIDN
jgi:hypothetical protein